MSSSPAPTADQPTTGAGPINVILIGCIDCFVTDVWASVHADETGHDVTGSVCWDCDWEAPDSGLNPEAIMITNGKVLPIQFPTQATIHEGLYTRQQPT